MSECFSGHTSQLSQWKENHKWKTKHKLDCWQKEPSSTKTSSSGKRADPRAPARHKAMSSMALSTAAHDKYHSLNRLSDGLLNGEIEKGEPRRQHPKQGPRPRKPRCKLRARPGGEPSIRRIEGMCIKNLHVRKDRIMKQPGGGTSWRWKASNSAFPSILHCTRIPPLLQRKNHAACCRTQHSGASERRC